MGNLVTGAAYAVDIESLYEMAREAAEGARESLAGPDTYNLASGYVAYFEEYNRLVSEVIRQCGNEAQQFFPLIDPSEFPSPQSVRADLWRSYLERAAARLRALAAYLRSRVAAPEKQVEAVYEVIETKLRPMMRTEKPEKESDVQNALESLLIARSLDYERDKIRIPYSSKSYSPDFTLDSFDLAVEVKLCKEPQDEKRIVGEINEDIPAYSTKYRHIIFVVYDLGIIANVAQFRAGIESNAGVRVLVVKH